MKKGSFKKIALLGFGVFFLFALSTTDVFSANTQISLRIAGVCGNGTKEYAEQCDNGDFGGKNCSDLGYSGGILNCTAGCQYDTSVCATSAETSDTSSFTYSAGGSYISSNSDDTSATVSLPANFYSEDLQLQMFSYPSTYFTTDKPAISGESFVGKAYDFVFVDQSGSNVSTLSKSATITLTYNDADVSSIDESTIAPYRWGSDDTAWQLISGSTVNAGANTVTFSNASFSSVALLGSPIQQSQTNTNNRGHSGGGGTAAIAPAATKVIFAGHAYPSSIVTLLKDAQVAATFATGNNPGFRIELSGLAGGSYIFSIYATDKHDRRSAPLTFPVTIVAGATTQVSDILIPATIAVDKSEVKHGDSVGITGQTVPNADVTILLNPATPEEKSAKAKADPSGSYLYNLDTDSLAPGQQLLKSKASVDGEGAPYGRLISFIVGAKNVKTTAEGKIVGDSNNDSRINLVDFSVMAYWYNKPEPSPAVDLNSDGQVDLIDFSILAFYWTG